MKCPNCATPMNAGRVKITQSTAGAVGSFVLGFFAGYGGSAHHLFFSPESGEDSTLELECGVSRRAFLCPSCRALVLVRKKKHDGSNGGSPA
jgi:hypothetical protein